MDKKIKIAYCIPSPVSYTNLVHVYACDTNLLVTFHNDTVIRFVIEIGRAVDVVHFHTRGNACLLYTSRCV